MSHDTFQPGTRFLFHRWAQWHSEGTLGPSRCDKSREPDTGAVLSMGAIGAPCVTAVTEDSGGGVHAFPYSRETFKATL